MFKNRIQPNFFYLIFLQCRRKDESKVYLIIKNINKRYVKKQNLAQIYLFILVCFFAMKKKKRIKKNTHIYTQPKINMKINSN